MPEATPDSAFDSQELDFLVRFLDTGFGRISAAVVSGPAVGSALLDVLRERLPGQVFRIEDTEHPAELDPIVLGERAEEASRSGEIFVLPLDGRHRPIDGTDEAEFWRRMNYQRERLAADDGRTLFLLDGRAEAHLTGFADDLHDWVRTFRFPEIPTTLPRPAVPAFSSLARGNERLYDPDHIASLRRQLERARQQGVAESQISRIYALPLMTFLVANHRPTEAAQIWEQELRGGEALEPLKWPADQIVYMNRIDLAALEGDKKSQELWTTRYLQTVEDATERDRTARSVTNFLDAISRRGQALLDQERFSEAIRLFERGLNEVEKEPNMFTDESVGFIRSLFLARLGLSYERLGRTETAEKYLRTGVETSRHLTETTRSNPAYLSELSMALGALGAHIWKHANRPSEALQYCEESLEVARTVFDMAPSYPFAPLSAANALQITAALFHSLGRLREAKALYREHLAMARSHLERDPGNAIWQRALSRTIQQLEGVELDKAEPYTD